VVRVELLSDAVKSRFRDGILACRFEICCRAKPLKQLRSRRAAAAREAEAEAANLWLKSKHNPKLPTRLPKADAVH